MELVKERPKAKKPKKRAESKKSSFSVEDTSDEKLQQVEKKIELEPHSVKEPSVIELQQEKKLESSVERASTSISITSPCFQNLSENLKSIENGSCEKEDTENLHMENTVHGEKSLCLKEGIKTLGNKNGFISEIKESSNQTKEKNVLDDVKTLNACDEKTMIRNVYPDLKSIQHYEWIEDIESVQTLVRTYTEEYINKTYHEANKKCQEFQVAVAGIENYPLFELIKDYQYARKMSSEAQTKRKYLISKFNIEKNNLWKLVKKEVSSKGCCDDGLTVSVSKNYFVKELDESKFSEVMEILRELEEVVLSNAFYSYSDELSKMKIEQYVYNMINYLDSTDDSSSENPYNLGINKKGILKKCISILFQYQRQSIKDKDFLHLCQKWLKKMVFVLLQNGKRSDYLFVVNHIIRSPNGIQTWASQLLQLPIHTSCSEENQDIFSCPCLYYGLLVLYLVLNPAPDRDFFLRNVKNSASDSTDGKFTLLDSDGEEEELFEIIRDWTNDDVISLLNQISIAGLYEHILFESRDETIVIKCPSKERIIKMFAFSTALITILFSGLSNYCKDEFTSSVECICSMIRHIVCYVSDHWKHCQDLNISSKSALQAEYDRFVFHVVFSVFNFERLRVWKFLATLPYKCVSKKMLWNIIWIFHSPNCFEENVYLAKDIDMKLNDDGMISIFIEKLKSVKHCDQIYLLNAYKSLALCGNTDKDLLCFIIHEIFEVAFIENSLCHLSKEGTIVLTSIMKKHSDMLSTLLKEIRNHKDEDVNRSICVFEELDLTEWVPKSTDVQLLREWLLEMPLSSPKNYLTRMLLLKMNWGFSSQGDLVLPLGLHQEIAVLVLQAYMKFDRKGNEWSVSSGFAQMRQFATVGSFIREDEGFVPWAWDLLFSLKLHALDKQFPLWVQIYDGFLEVDFLPDPFEELWLQPLLKGYEEKHPVACYLFLVMTNVGHNVRRLLVEGLQCLTALVGSCQYLAAIQSLYYIIPFFVKNSEELLSQPEFINVMNDLIVADMTMLSSISGPVIGAVLHKIAAMIKHQISQAWALTVECATPLIKLWISILLKVLLFQEGKNYNLKDSAKQVHFLLDVVIRISFIDSYTRNNMIDLLYNFGNPLLTSTMNVQSSIWSKFFGSNTESYTILRRQTLPDYPLLAWYILRSEIKQKQSQDLWYQVQKEIARDLSAAPIIALKKACSFLKVKQPALESLPIYRWCLQILQTPVYHPVLPLLWQQFFYYYFEKISIFDSEAPKSLGLYYFKTPDHFQLLKKLKSRALEAADYYQNSYSEPNNEGSLSSGSEQRTVTKECIHNIELCKVFRAFSLWIEETNLHQPSLCFSALGPKYCCERLKLIFNNDQQDWFDLVSVDLLKDDLEQKVHCWVRKKKYSFTSHIGLESLEESPCARMTRHLNNNTAVKPLSCFVDINPPMREVEDIALSSWSVLVQLIESKHNVIFEKAKSFTELASKLKQLNYNYKNLVPQEFTNEDRREICTKTCHRNLNCSGPATFNLLVKHYVANQRICEKLENNRMEHRMVQDQLLNLSVAELCTASVHIENYIKCLSRKMENAKNEDGLQFKKLGVSLFYHQIEAVNKAITSVKNYTPSRNFFSTSIESLGNVFIRDQEDQICALAKAILQYPEAGELAFEIFNPNVASIAVFLDVYESITSKIKFGSPNTIFVLLNKIDLKRILREKGVNFCDRRRLFKDICKTLLECGPNPPEDLQMVHDILSDHFCFTLSLTFPEFYEDAIKFVLNGMETNRLSTAVWYKVLHCFGCSTLNEKSSMLAIESSLQKFADNLLLPPDQQIFVSSQPINIKEVIGTLERLHHKFMAERKACNLYEVYKMHIKPFGIFLALLSHSLLSMLNENLYQRQVSNISQLWQSLHDSFYPWLHPLRKETSFMFPWTDDQMSNARFMFQMFTACLKNFHEKLLGYNCEKCILSYLWNSYVEIYVKPGLRHYSVSLCHTEFLCLPWDQFHPNSEDLEGMCLVLQSDLLENRDFLAKVSLKIPWIEIMKNISETKSPEYVRKTLVTLGKLLIVSGLDVSLTKSNLHQNNLKALEELSWYLISLEDAETLLQLYYSTSDPMNLLNEDLNNSDVYVLQFLKIVCCLAVGPNVVDYPQSNSKRLLYLHKYISALTLCISAKNELILKNPEKFQKLLPSLFSDIEGIIATAVKPDLQMSCALPLVNEAIGFLNKITDTKLEAIVIDSILSWLKANPRSPLLLPCLQTACRCLNQMTNAVMIVECCIATRFNTDLHDPVEARTIWQMILASFQVRSSMTDEFVHACINKNAFLTLYCHVLDRIPKTSTSESRKMLLLNLTDWINRCEIKENDEAKCLLLWDKILELSVILAHEDNLQAVKTTLSAFCRKISIFGEDKTNDGFLGSVFGRSSNLSVNFRFLCRIVVAFLLLQMPLNASIRLQPMDPGLLPVAEMKGSAVTSSKSTEPSPSAAALKAVEKVKALLNNKSYSALKDLVNSAIDFVIDPRHCLNESRTLLKDYALHVFPKQYFLYGLG